MNNSSRPCAPVWRNSTQKTTLFIITVLLVLERPVAGGKDLLLLVMLVKTCCCAPVRKTCWDKQQALKKKTRCYVAGVKMQASCTAGVANVCVHHQHPRWRHAAVWIVLISFRSEVRGCLWLLAFVARRLVLLVQDLHQAFAHEVRLLCRPVVPLQVFHCGQ